MQVSRRRLSACEQKYFNILVTAERAMFAIFCHVCRIIMDSSTFMIYVWRDQIRQNRPGWPGQDLDSPGPGSRPGQA